MRILIVEGDKEVCEQIQLILVKECFAVDLCSGAADGIRWLQQSVHDLALIGRPADEQDAQFFVQQADISGILTPTLVFAVRCGEGMAPGNADFYLTKPVSKRELLPPIWALLHQIKRWDDCPLLSCGELVLDTAKRQLWHGGRSTTLTRRENTLIEFLLENQGAILSREQLFAQTWGTGSGVNESNLDNYIANARKRLREVCSPLELVTVKAKGYCLRAVK